MRGLKDKVVIVTGAAQGIGAAIAQRFAEEGSKLAILDLNLELASETANKLAQGAIAVKADITDYEAVQNAVIEVNSRLGAIDVLVNNAGWDVFKPFVETEPNL